MVVRDLDLVSVALSPLEADAILIVDANAVLALPVAFQPFQTVAGRQQQVSQRSRRVQHLQFLQRCLVDTRRDAAAAFFLPQPLGFSIPECLDHAGWILSWRVTTVKRQ